MFHSKNKQKMKNILKIALLAYMAIYFISCEDLKFGNEFLENAQSQEINLDSIFSKKIVKMNDGNKTKDNLFGNYYSIYERS